MAKKSPANKNEKLIKTKLAKKIPAGRKRNKGSSRRGKQSFFPVQQQ